MTGKLQPIEMQIYGAQFQWMHLQSTPIPKAHAWAAEEGVERW